MTFGYSGNRNRWAGPVIASIGGAVAIGLLFWSSTARTDSRLEQLQAQIDLVQQDADFKVRQAQMRAQQMQERFNEVSRQLELLHDRIGDGATAPKAGGKRGLGNTRGNGHRGGNGPSAGLEDLGGGGGSGGAPDDPTSGFAPGVLDGKKK